MGVHPFLLRMEVLLLSSPGTSHLRVRLLLSSYSNIRLPVRYIADILVDASRSFFWIALLEGIGGQAASFKLMAGGGSERVPLQYRVKKRVVSVIVTRHIKMEHAGIAHGTTVGLPVPIVGVVVG